MVPCVVLECVTPLLPRNSKSGRGDWIRTSDPLRPSGKRRVFRRFSAPSDLAELGLIDQYQFVVLAQMSQMLDGSRRPDDGHTRGAFRSRLRPHE